MSEKLHKQPTLSFVILNITGSLIDLCTLGGSISGGMVKKMQGSVSVL
jgi:hypothetical protein